MAIQPLRNDDLQPAATQTYTYAPPRAQLIAVFFYLEGSVAPQKLPWLQMPEWLASHVGQLTTFEHQERVHLGKFPLGRSYLVGYCWYINTFAFIPLKVI